MALVATTSPFVHQYTLDEFWSLDDPPGGGHYELIAGVLYIVPPPDGPHTTVVSRLNRRFAAYLDLHPQLGELFSPALPSEHPRKLLNNECSDLQAGTTHKSTVLAILLRQFVY